MQIKLTNQQILTLEQAINSLDGKPYKIAALARLTMARNAAVLRGAVNAFNDAKSAIITQHGGEKGEIKPDHANWAAFVKDYETILHTPVELELTQFALADLRLDENEKAGNEFPIATLNALLPLIHTF